MLAVTIGLSFSLASQLKAEQRLTILKAAYSAGDVQRDVTPILNKKIQNGKVQIKVSNGSLGGDPSPGKVKSLTVLYRNANGDFSISASEGERLLIPNPQAVLVAPAGRATANPDLSDTSPTRAAPDGIYYLTERRQVTTEDGIVGIPAGTLVERISDSVLTMKVKSGEREFEIDKSILTNDLDVAEAIQQADQSQTMQRETAIQQHRIDAISSAKREAELVEKTNSEAKLEQSATKFYVEVSQVISNGILGQRVNPPTNGPGETIGPQFFMEGVKGVAEGQRFGVMAYRSGTYTYSDTRGASRTVEKWKFVKRTGDYGD